jgi:hypothetical protein
MRKDLPIFSELILLKTLLKARKSNILIWQMYSQYEMQQILKTFPMSHLMLFSFHLMVLTIFQMLPEESVPIMKSTGYSKNDECLFFRPTISGVSR